MKVEENLNKDSSFSLRAATKGFEPVILREISMPVKRRVVFVILEGFSSVDAALVLPLAVKLGLLLSSESSEFLWWRWFITRKKGRGRRRKKIRICEVGNGVGA